MAREIKDSGIEWIGEIPTDWSIGFAFQIFTPVKNRNIGLLETNLLSLSYGKIKHKSINTTEGLLPESFDSYNIIECDDIVLRLTDLQNDHKSLRVGRSIERGIITSAYLTLRPSNNSFSQYMYYFLYSFDICKGLYGMGSGVRQGLNWDDIKHLQILLPTLAEQQRIAAFLDRKCAEIDSIIADTQKTIEEYKALKQSIITEAVTKGVRGERKMKDSGVEWIGDVPEEWEVIPVKYVAEFQPSCDMSNLTDDSIITYLPMEHLKNGYYIQNTAFYGSVASSLTPFMNGDIVMAKVTPCFENGNIAIMNDLSSGVGMGSSELFVYRPLDVQTKYLLYWLQNILFKQAACATMTGTGGLKRVSPYFAKHSKMTLPCYKEQLEIIRYLDEKCTSLDKLIESKQQLLTELESYKKSVIYEYVTGKKECGIAVAQVTQAAIVPFYPAAISTKRVRFAQAVLMAKVLDKCHKGMGRVKLEKTMYTIETIIGFDFETEYVRQVAGPLDESLYKCEGIISRVNHWYTVCASQHGVSYKPTKNADKYQSYYCRYFRNYNTEIERIIDIFASYTTEQAEVIATLLAAWNDAIIEGKSFTDTDIVNDVLNNWSEEKKRFSKDVWLRAMDELRKKDLMPKGYGKKTVRRNIK